MTSTSIIFQFNCKKQPISKLTSQNGNNPNKTLIQTNSDDFGCKCTLNYIPRPNGILFFFYDLTIITAKIFEKEGGKIGETLTKKRHRRGADHDRPHNGTQRTNCRTNKEIIPIFYGLQVSPYGLRDLYLISYISIFVISLLFCNDLFYCFNVAGYGSNCNGL